jgi:oxygen-independent coproporphyrinogen-3 oxidase
MPTFAVMSGLYIHIPFCRRHCLYCDFYSTICTEDRAAYVCALMEEMRSRSRELPLPVQTLYIGGGTPSLLPLSLLERLAGAWWDCFVLAPDAELTIEANPDDLTPTYLRGLRRVGFNRLSIGVQSFQDKTLRLLGRRHTAAQARNAVHAARDAGFDNLSLDLIYGLPNEGLDVWEDNLEQALALCPEHLSAYLLTYEEGTPLTRLRDEGTLHEASEDLAVALYQHLCRRLLAAGYEHYEISNFALPGCSSRHNSSYWQGVPYLGLGAAAHSYDGQDTRQLNAPSLAAYLAAPGRPPHETELLDLTTKYHEYLLTRLRTRQGITLSAMQTFGMGEAQTLTRTAVYLRQGLMCREGDRLYLTDEGMFLADRITISLM